VEGIEKMWTHALHFSWFCKVSGLMKNNRKTQFFNNSNHERIPNQESLQEENLLMKIINRNITFYEGNWKHFFRGIQLWQSRPYLDTFRELGTFHYNHFGKGKIKMAEIRRNEERRERFLLFPVSNGVPLTPITQRCTQHRGTKFHTMCEKKHTIPILTPPENSSL
jgi:hypothetical protein